MRKNIFSIVALFAVVLFLTSCGAQKKSGASSTGPSASQWRAGVKGTWVLNSVNREDIPQNYTIKNIFDEAPVDCFIGSVWDLPGGRQQGTISFHSTGTLCAPGAVRTIVWSIYKPEYMGEQPEFQFKKLYAGDKASNVTSGYRLGLSYADEGSLIMRMPVDLSNGKVGYLVFNFTRA